MQTTDLAEKLHSDPGEFLQGDLRTQQLLSRLVDTEALVGELIDKGIRITGLHITDRAELLPIVHVKESAALENLPGCNEARLSPRMGTVFLEYGGCHLCWSVLGGGR
ncbi:MAG: hypothetical protein JWL63_3242 [Rhodocyclales bacterium]|nr:hypothetical protein [Rhodocyclales bacterium]